MISLDLRICLLEYSGMWSLEMQVLAEGRWLSSAGLMVTLGIGWNPSSLAGRAGEPVQKETRSCFSRGLIFSITAHNHLLNVTNLSLDSPDSSLKEVYPIKVVTFMSPTPFSKSLKSSAVRVSSDPAGITSNNPSRIFFRAFSWAVIILYSAYFLTYW